MSARTEPPTTAADWTETNRAHLEWALARLVEERGLPGDITEHEVGRIADLRSSLPRSAGEEQLGDELARAIHRALGRRR